MARPGLFLRQALSKSASTIQLVSRSPIKQRALPFALRFASGRPERGAYKQLSEADFNHFRSIAASPTSILTADKEDLTSYNVDWMDKYHGSSKLVLRPKSAEEISKILSYCFRENIAIVPQGGNTGLVGGGVPVHDEVILRLDGLDKIRSFDEVSGILTVDAGCVLEKIDNFLQEKGYTVPIDLGAKGSCHIGGNVSTNAGGLRLLRYGSLHGSVLGVEAVVPDEKGTILRSGMSGLRKDNTGYDLKQLFIGAEGTLGVVTGVCLLVPKKSSSTNVAIFSVPSFAAIQDVFTATRSHLGEILSAFEFFDHQALSLVLKHTGQQRPFSDSSDSKAFSVLIETSGSNSDHDSEKISNLLEYLMDKEIIQDGVLAQDETQLRSLWSLRESIPEAAGKLGKVYKYDLSMPVGQMYQLVEDARERFKEQGLFDDGTIKEVVGYGHVGDGNLHINVVAKQWDSRVEEALEPWIYEWVASRNGSISAEHGLGLMKAPYIGYSQPGSNIEMMKRIKDVFDPKKILNPYKYFLA